MDEVKVVIIVPKVKKIVFLIVETIVIDRVIPFKNIRARKDTVFL